MLARLKMFGCQEVVIVFGDMELILIPPLMERARGVLDF
jgi:hypothetical protein